MEEQEQHYKPAHTEGKICSNNVIEEEEASCSHAVELMDIFIFT